jgi:putative nucleotidyltransferase with HDIG domain
MNPDTILFVDDEKNILKSVSRLFADKDCHFLTASNSKEALQIISDTNIAVIVTDNMMPGMKGVELLSVVKDISPDTVRILMTGQADLPTAIAAINTGEVFKLVLKPWDNTELIDIVQQARDRYLFTTSLKRTDEATLLSLAQTIELKDPYTRGHCDRVAQYAIAIAEALEFTEEDMVKIKYGCWLHDCGKIGVPESILNKNGPPEPDELKILRKHPGWGADVANQAKLDPVIVNIILYHHEQFGGGGYPRGICGKDIPIEARIVAVADVFDALTTDRPYRKGFSFEKAIAMLDSMKGSHLEAELVDIFKRIHA